MHVAGVDLTHIPTTRKNISDKYNTFIANGFLHKFIFLKVQQKKKEKTEKLVRKLFCVILNVIKRAVNYILCTACAIS